MKTLSPQQKKRKSYQKDCRNCYGENDKASRKNIPRNKQRGHRQERHVASNILNSLNEACDDVLLDETVDKFKDKVKAKRLNAFRKCPDMPLGRMLEWRKRMSQH